MAIGSGRIGLKVYRTIATRAEKANVGTGRTDEEVIFFWEPKGPLAHPYI